jgi:hypothetical protein
VIKSMGLPLLQRLLRSQMLVKDRDYTRTLQRSVTFD